jgi:16S rRNA (cytosine1402-N4)-methyltransferase
MSQPTPTSTHVIPIASPTTRTEHTTGTGSLIRSLPAGTMEGPYSARFPSSPIGETSRRAPAGREAADERSTCPRPHRLRRRSRTGPLRTRVPSESTPRLPSDPSSPSAFRHEPVLLERVVAVLGAVPPGLLVDATVGGGGHARALLEAHAGLSLIGVDQDDDALAAAASLGTDFPGRVQLVRSRFDRLAEVVATAGAGRPVVAVLFDLGVSSPQLDREDRGFSYRHDAPLDMRMDRRGESSAATIVNEYPEAELASVLRRYGDERYAGRIARAVVAARPVLTTSELADLVRDAIPAPARRRGGHPAKRTFQAIRIEVNDELGILPASIDDAVDLLATGGRIAVLSYHSGEDRIVKDRLRQAETGGCTCPPGLPCVCGAVPEVRLLRRGGWVADPAERARNPRAESARLRAAERLAPSTPVDAGEVSR